MSMYLYRVQPFVASYAVADFANLQRFTNRSPKLAWPRCEKIRRWFPLLLVLQDGEYLILYQMSPKFHCKEYQAFYIMVGSPDELGIFQCHQLFYSPKLAAGHGIRACLPVTTHLLPLCFWEGLLSMRAKSWWYFFIFSTCLLASRLSLPAAEVCLKTTIIIWKLERLQTAQLIKFQRPIYQQCDLVDWYLVKSSKWRLFYMSHQSKNFQHFKLSKFHFGNLFSVLPKVLSYLETKLFRTGINV